MFLFITDLLKFWFLRFVVGFVVGCGVVVVLVC